MKYLTFILLITVALLHGCNKLGEKTRTYYNNGKMEFEYGVENGKKNGQLYKYYDSGEKEYVINMKNNMKNGIETYYYKNGILKHKGRYALDKKTGFFIYYDKNGKIDSLVEYVQLCPDNPFSSFINPEDYNDKVENTNRKIVYNKDGKVNHIKSVFFEIETNKDTFNIGDSLKIRINFVLQSLNRSNLFKVYLFDKSINKALVTDYQKGNIVYLQNLQVSNKTNTLKGMIQETTASGLTNFFFFEKNITVR